TTGAVRKLWTGSSGNHRMPWSRWFLGSQTRHPMMGKNTGMRPSSLRATGDQWLSVWAMTATEGLEPVQYLPAARIAPEWPPCGSARLDQTASLARRHAL